MKSGWGSLQSTALPHLIQLTERVVAFVNKLHVIIFYFSGNHKKTLIISRFRQKWNGQTLNDEGNYTKMGTTNWKLDVNKNLEIAESWLGRIFYEGDETHSWQIRGSDELQVMWQCCGEIRPIPKRTSYFRLATLNHLDPCVDVKQQENETRYSLLRPRRLVGAEGAENKVSYRGGTSKPGGRLRTGRGKKRPDKLLPPQRYQ